MEKDLVYNLKSKLNLPDIAIAFLAILYECIQTFDDFADGDKVTRESLNALIWNSLAALPDNDFFYQNKTTLIPIISSMILKWQASDFVERNGSSDEKSFVWRAGYYDVVLTVVQICHGAKFATENAHVALGLYGEKYEDYKKEFDKCQIQ